MLRSIRKSPAMSSILVAVVIVITIVVVITFIAVIMLVIVVVASDISVAFVDMALTRVRQVPLRHQPPASHRYKYSKHSAFSRVRFAAQAAMWPLCWLKCIADYGLLFLLRRAGVHITFILFLKFCFAVAFEYNANT